MATQQEIQTFLDTVAAGHLLKFLEAAKSRREFVRQYKLMRGEDGLAPEDNRGLPAGETPIPIDATMISIAGLSVTAAQLHQAFLLEEANDIQVTDNDIEFIENFVKGLS